MTAPTHTCTPGTCAPEHTEWKCLAEAPEQSDHQTLVVCGLPMLHDGSPHDYSLRLGPDPKGFRHRVHDWFRRLVERQHARTQRRADR